MEVEPINCGQAIFFMLSKYFIITLLLWLIACLDDYSEKEQYLKVMSFIWPAHIIILTIKFFRYFLKWLNTSPTFFREAYKQFKDEF